jgi:hypothetical protein
MHMIFVSQVEYLFQVFLSTAVVVVIKYVYEHFITNRSENLYVVFPLKV